MAKLIGYTVVEEAGYEGEEEVKHYTHPSDYMDALKWMHRTYQDWEIDRYNVRIRGELDDGTSTYEVG